MSIRHALLGAATVAALTACGTGTTSQAAPTPTPSSATVQPTSPTSTTPTSTTPTSATPAGGQSSGPATDGDTTASTTPGASPDTTSPAARPVPPATKPSATPAAPKPATPAGLAKGTPCKATADACIDLSANQSWLIADGKASYGPVPITHGRSGWETPPGTFTVGWKSRHHRSSLFDNAPMPYSVFFNGGIAFHQGSLQQKSHGCIHLSPTAAAKYFGALQVGDIVQVVR